VAGAEESSRGADSNRAAFFGDSGRLPLYDPSRGRRWDRATNLSKPQRPGRSGHGRPSLRACTHLVRRYRTQEIAGSSPA